MRLWLPLLVVVSSCSSLSAAFHVNVTQEVYEAEENRDVLLEWTFTTSPQMKNTSLTVLCAHRRQRKISSLYRVFAGVEDQGGPDKHFVGRVQGDRDALREGRISLLLSRVTRNDTGEYRCQVITPGGRDRATCRLNVSEQPAVAVSESAGALSLYDWRLLAPVLTAAVVLIIAACAAALYVSRKREERNVHSRQ